MAYIQLVEPNIDIIARAGMCLEYVDNAVNAPKRTATAQIAYETAKGNGWVSPNTEYPKNVWFVLFWSIDNNDYAGLGHVALAFVDDDGNMQIHDSEVHRGARQPYTSLEELSAWFGSVGTRLTYLGWSIGVDGVQIVEEIGKDEQKQTEEIEMYLINCIDSKRWYVSTGVDVRYVKTIRMLSNYKNQFGKLNLRVDKMYQSELDAEFGKNATDPKRDISK